MGRETIWVPGEALSDSFPLVPYQLGFTPEPCEQQPVTPVATFFTLHNFVVVHYRVRAGISWFSFG